MVPAKRCFFNDLAENWDRDDRVPYVKYRKIIKEARIKDRQKILDVGTGTGVLIPYILEAAGRDIAIFAVDYSEKMIENFKKKNFPENVKPFVADIQKTGLEDDYFDRITINSCYPHFDEKPAVLKELYRILKQDGILIISHPTGRHHVNTLHKTHSLIEEDMIDDIPQMKGFIESFGFRFRKGIDENDFFLISFTK